jgi:hypothetical protein
MKPIYSSKQVERDVYTYSREDEKFIQQQKFEAAVLKATQKERFNIRSYPETEQDYYKLS